MKVSGTFHVLRIALAVVGHFKQLVTIAAPDRPTAEQVLEADLRELQEHSEPDDVRFANGGWSVDEIPLDEPQVVGFTVVPR